MPVSEGCLRDNKRFAVICLENSKCWWIQWLCIHDTLPDSLYISGNGFMFPEHRWTSHIACLMACHPFFQEIVVEQNLTENLMLESHSPLCMSLLLPVPPTWQHFFMLLPKFAICYMGEKASTTDHHAQRELCAYKRQLLLLWDSCSLFKVLFAPNEERVKTIKKFF